MKTVAADVLAQELDHQREVHRLIAGRVEHHVEVAAATVEHAPHRLGIAAVGLQSFDSVGHVRLAAPAVEDRHLMPRRAQSAERGGGAVQRNAFRPGVELSSRRGPFSRCLHLQTAVLPAQPTQLLTLRRRHAVLATPPSRSACLTQLRIACADGSNSLPSSSGEHFARASSTNCRRYSGGYGGRDRGIANPFTPKGDSVHGAGSTSFSFSSRP